MTGMNNFSTIPLADPDANEGADRGIVTGTVPESERIAVQPGDVVGYHLMSTRGGRDGIQYAGDDENEPDYEDEMVWYTIGSTISSTSICPQSSSSNNELMWTNRAPLVTATVSKYMPSSTAVPITPLPTDNSTAGVDNSSLVAGFVVALLVVIVIAVLTIVIVVVLMRKHKARSREGIKPVMHIIANCLLQQCNLDTFTSTVQHVLYVPSNRCYSKKSSI